MINYFPSFIYDFCNFCYYTFTSMHARFYKSHTSATSLGVPRSWFSRNWLFSRKRDWNNASRLIAYPRIHANPTYAIIFSGYSPLVFTFEAIHAQVHKFKYANVLTMKYKKFLRIFWLICALLPDHVARYRSKKVILSKIPYIELTESRFMRNTTAQ